jgi:hypothetical protein
MGHLRSSFRYPPRRALALALADLIEPSGKMGKVMCDFFFAMLRYPDWLAWGAGA